MKIIFNNVDFNSRSGPNNFGLKLARSFVKNGNYIVLKDGDVCLNFIQGYQKDVPNVLRLDGIYFNSKQDWMTLNSPIYTSYINADHVIVQSKFDKLLIQTFFGDKKEDTIHVINNGTDLNLINNMMPKQGFDRNKTWMCASAWRSHKRINDNVKLFQQYADEDSILLIAGSNISDHLTIQDSRIKILGDLRWEEMISYMKASSNFIHLAWLDHCPNVVVDAMAAGCTLHVSDSGGTKELVGLNDNVYQESVCYNFNVIDLYNPPDLIIENNRFVKIDVAHDRACIDIEKISKKYLKVLQNATNTKTNS